MTALALTHALKTIAVPAGRRLWLYGDPTHAEGDVYTPWYSAAHKSRSDTIHLHADIKTLAPHYEAVIVNSPKQQEEAEGLLALALQTFPWFCDGGGGQECGRRTPCRHDGSIWRYVRYIIQGQLPRCMDIQGVGRQT